VGLLVEHQSMGTRVLWLRGI